MLKNILDQYKKMATPAKAAIWFMVCSIIPQVITVAMTTVFTRILSTDDYGISSNYYAWYNIINRFISLSLYCDVYNNAMAKYKEKRNEFTSAMMGLSLLLGVIGVTILTVFRNTFSNWMNLPVTLVIYMGLHCLFYNPYGCWVSRTRFEYNYRSLIKVTLLVSILSPLTSLIFIILFKDKAVGKVVGQYLIYLFLGLILYVRMISKCGKIYDKEYWKFAIRFNLPLIPHYLSSILLNQADRVMITSYCGASDNGLYSVAYSAASLILLFNTGVTQAITPWMYEQVKKKNYSVIRRICSIICFIYIICDFVFILLAPEIIGVLAGEKYKSAIYVIPPIAASMYFILLYNIYCIIEFYYEKTISVMVCSAVAAILNVGLNFIFIPKYGFIAAAYTTLICYLVNAVLHAAILKKICREEQLKGVMSIGMMLALGGVLIGLMAMASMLYEYTLVRWIIIVSIGAIFVINRKRLYALYQQIRLKKN